MGRLIKQSYGSGIDGATIDYALWLPSGYDQARNWPLIVFLHGSGEGKNWKAPTAVQASVPVLGDRADLPFLVAFPLMRGSWSISALAERDVLDTIADVQQHYAVDPDRVHLVGLSLGGFAAWRLACRYPDRFASLTVFCGGGEPELAVNLRHIPVRVYHGAQDGSVPVDHSREMVAALREVGLPVDYAELPQAKHVVWRQPLHDPALYRWMAQQRRVQSPRRVSYRTRTLRHGRAYWLTIESMVDPSVPAFVDVFVPPGQAQVLVHAENVGRLVVDVPSELLGGTDQPRFLADGPQTAATRTDAGWVLELSDAPPADLIKRPGLSGPIQDALLDAFVVSVATPADAESARAWSDAAAQGLAWTSQLVTSAIKLMPATEVTPELMSRAHLICFGDPSNHPLLARVADRLPLLADSGRLFLDGEPLSSSLAAFVMVHPNPLAPERYLVVCSGRPAAVGRLAAMALSPPSLNPEPLEDLILLRNDGALLPWDAGKRAETGQKRLSKGVRLPQRGAIFARSWRLTPQARGWLRAEDSP
jgi:predicted esterase